MIRWSFILVLIALIPLVSCKDKEKPVIQQTDKLIASGDFRQALDVLQQALKDNPDDEELQCQRIRLFLRAGQVDYAVAGFRVLAAKHAKTTVFSDALKDKDPVMRVAAAKAFGLLGDSSAADSLLAAVNDPERAVRQAAVTALGDIKNEKAVPVLLAYLKDKDWLVRAEAAHALGNLKSEKAISSLFVLLKDEDQYVRRNARQALQNLATQDTRRAYLQALSSSNSNMKITAALALAQMGDNSASATLLDQFPTAQPDDQEAIIKALVELKEPKALSLLRDNIKAENLSVRIHAIVGLGWLRDTESAKQLEQMASDKNESGETRLAAMRALELLKRKP